MANGFDWGQLLGQSGFAQTQEGIGQELPWWKNANLLASFLGETGYALDPGPTNPLAGAGKVAAQFGQSNIMEAARRKKDEENRQLMQYMIGLMGGGGFTPPDQPGPTSIKANDKGLTFEMTPNRADLALAPFPNPSTTALQDFQTPTPETTVSDFQRAYPFP